jgi:hypothetical protein
MTSVYNLYPDLSVLILECKDRQLWVEIAQFRELPFNQ